jgi:hypothetical protein
VHPALREGLPAKRRALLVACTALHHCMALVVLVLIRERFAMGVRTVQAAFRLIDTGDTGYVEATQMLDMLRSQGQQIDSEAFWRHFKSMATEVENKTFKARPQREGRKKLKQPTGGTRNAITPKGFVQVMAQVSERARERASKREQQRATERARMREKAALPACLRCLWDSVGHLCHTTRGLTQHPKPPMGGMGAVGACVHGRGGSHLTVAGRFGWLLTYAAGSRAAWHRLHERHATHCLATFCRGCAPHFADCDPTRSPYRTDGAY